MNRDLAVSIVRMLAVTGAPSESPDRLKTFADREWQKTFAWLDDSGLALELLRAADRSGASVLPLWVKERLTVRLNSNRERIEQMKTEFDSLNRRLEQEGVDYAVLKGFSLVPTYTPDADLRTQYDYDYLVHPRSLGLAKKGIESSGRRQGFQNRELDPEGVASFLSEPLDCSARDEEWYTSRIARRVELHIGLWEHHHDTIKIDVPQDVLERKRFASWQGLRFPVLAEDDALLFQCLHAFHHVLDYWCRPSCFLEIARFLARPASNQDLWDRLRSRIAGRPYLSEIIGLIFRLCSELFSAPIPEGWHLTGANRRSRALDLWARRYGSAWCLASYPGSKLSLFVYREFVDDPVVWSAVRRSRLLPFHRTPRVAEPREPGPRAVWNVRRQQWGYTAARLKHHVSGLATYAWQIRKWENTLRGAGATASQESWTRKPGAGPVLPITGYSVRDEK